MNLNHYLIEWVSKERYKALLREAEMDRLLRPKKQQRLGVRKRLAVNAGNLLITLGYRLKGHDVIFTQLEGLNSQPCVENSESVYR